MMGSSRDFDAVRQASEEVEPAVVSLARTLHHIEELRLDEARDGADRSRADLAVVHHPNGGDLGGGAAEEDLVGDIELLA